MQGNQVTENRWARGISDKHRWFPSQLVGAREHKLFFSVKQLKIQKYPRSCHVIKLSNAQVCDNSEYYFFGMQLTCLFSSNEKYRKGNKITTSQFTWHLKCCFKIYCSGYIRSLNLKWKQNNGALKQETALLTGCYRGKGSRLHQAGDPGGMNPHEGVAGCLHW